MTTSTNNLGSDYDVLKARVTSLQMELEKKNQLIYDRKNELAVAKALEWDYMQEIEALQRTDNSDVQQLRIRFKELQESIVTLRQTSNSKLLQRDELLESLKSKVTELKRNIAKDNVKKKPSDETKVYAEKNFKLNEEIKQLCTASHELETHIKHFEMQNVELEESQNILLIELENTKQNLTSKTQELTETNNVIHRLQEELFLIKLDLESLKSKPLDAAKRGNSLFAEVEDSRVKIEQSIQQMRKKYVEMKRDVCNKLKQMAPLRAENIRLSEELDSSKVNNEHYEKLIEEYKIEIHTLESAIEECKEKVLKEQTFTGKDLRSDDVEFANNFLKRIWKSEEEARQYLNTKSKEKLETVQDIVNADAEMQKWRRKALQLKVNIEKLENTLIEMQLQNSPDSIVDVNKQQMTADVLSNYKN